MLYATLQDEGGLDDLARGGADLKPLEGPVQGHFFIVEALVVPAVHFQVADVGKLLAED